MPGGVNPTLRVPRGGPSGAGRPYGQAARRHLRTAAM